MKACGGPTLLQTGRPLSYEISVRQRLQLLKRLLESPLPAPRRRNARPVQTGFINTRFSNDAYSTTSGTANHSTNTAPEFLAVRRRQPQLSSIQ